MTAVGFFKPASRHIGGAQQRAGERHRAKEAGEFDPPVFFERLFIAA
jgi:hypothetical protein